MVSVASFSLFRLVVLLKLYSDSCTYKSQKLMLSWDDELFTFTDSTNLMEFFVMCFVASKKSFIATLMLPVEISDCKLASIVLCAFSTRCCFADITV